MLWFLSFILTFAEAQEMPILSPRSLRSTNVQYEFSQTSDSSELRDSRFQLSVPLKAEEKSVWAVNFRGQRVEMVEEYSIQDRNLSIPQDFGGAEVGLSYAREREVGNEGVAASIGSTGRRLLDSENTRVLAANYFREWRKDESRSWYLFLNYSNNRTFLNNVPLPGVAYGISGTNYRLLLGVPVIMLSYSPQQWRLQAVLSPFMSSAQVAYVLSGPWQALSSVAWLPRSYQNIVPDEDGERLLFDRKDWSTGIAFNPAPPINLSLLYLYQFDRRFYVGESISKRRSSAVELADSGGVQLKLRWAF